MRRRCNRTRIMSTAIKASLERRYSNHRSQRGLEPLQGTLNRPPPHAYAQALVSRMMASTMAWNSPSSPVA